MTWRVCPVPLCAELVDKQHPCPKHARNTTGGYSPRDGAAHKRFARAVKKRDGYRCVRCGATENLRAHHLEPGNHNPSAGITVCAACHSAIDPHGR